MALRVFNVAGERNIAGDEELTIQDLLWNNAPMIKLPTWYVPRHRATSREATLMIQHLYSATL